jgi:DNA-directed RNA polymerase specialized sigma24 family protein
MLRVVDGMSFREIAEMLHIPLNTALGRMHYAVVRLRADLEKDRAEWCKGG